MNLITALVALAPPANFIVAASHPEIFNHLLHNQNRWRVAKVSESAWRRLAFELPALARRVKADLMHVTYTAPLWPGCRIVSTVHDVSFRPHPEWFSLRDRLVLGAGVGMTLARGADVITVSLHAASEISSFYSLPPNRIHVTLEAADPRFHALSGRKSEQFSSGLKIDRPFILAVGNLQPRKNILRLIQATAKLKLEGCADFQLVIAGKAKWRESDLYTEVKNLKLENDVLFLGHVTDDTLIHLYSQAVAFAYPSLYEGFGLPVLEAMACGAPVITSNCTSIPEVAGNAALLIDPTDSVALASAIRSVLENSTLRSSLREKSLRQAAQFSWEHTARETWNLYCKIAGKL
jgi:glycosyltransferase involved in cell wall biosynthesis